ncbi:MAG: hypothetical protein V4459_05590 [Pseudomonadota bacterium]
MSEPKPFASLSSGLLARKGQARPAMRPQGFNGGYAHLAGQMEDLGWNDMGQAEEPMAEVHALHDDDQTIAPPPEGVPPVLAQRRQLKEELEAPVLEVEVPIELEAEVEVVAEAPAPVPVPVVAPVSRPVSVATASRIARETKHKNKAAFTLRLDEDRHLRLRLASALSGRSAQLLVTEALDAFLESLPEVDNLARQVPTRAKG